MRNLNDFSIFLITLKYILVCYYSSFSKNNSVSPSKSGPLKAQAPPPRDLQKLYIKTSVSCEKNIICCIHLIPLVSYPLKTSDNQQFSDVFWEYRKRPVKWIRLKRSIVASNKIYFYAPLRQVLVQVSKTKNRCSNVLLIEY